MHYLNGNRRNVVRYRQSFKLSDSYVDLIRRSRDSENVCTCARSVAIRASKLAPRRAPSSIAGW